MIFRSPFVLALCLSPLASSYTLHESCLSSALDVAKLTAGIEGAFALAETVVKNFNNPRLDDLKNWVFGNLPFLAESYFIDLLKDPSLSKNLGFFDPSHKISFFCDLSQLQYDSEQDKTINHAVGWWNNRDLTKECDTILGTKRLEAFTGSGQAMDGTGSSYILICPHFLQDMQNAKMIHAPDFWESIGRVVTKSTFLSKILGLGERPSPMDGVALLERVILHELTHTLVAGHSADHLLERTSEKVYGWRAVREHSTSLIAYMNADSLALFAAAVDLIINRQATVSQDGDIGINPQPANQIAHSSMLLQNCTLEGKRETGATRGSHRLCAGANHRMSLR